MNRLRGLFVLASASLVAAAALVAAPRSAEACSYACATVPFHDKLLPPNVAALPLGYANGSDTPVLKLNGVIVPGTVRDPGGAQPLFIPDAPLTDGSYSLSHLDGCAGRQVETSFSVGAAAPDPEKTGTISVTTRFVLGSQRADGESLCGGPLPPAFDHMIATVVFEPASELKAYLPIMRFAETVDGPQSAVSSSFAVSPEVRRGVSEIIVNCEQGAAAAAGSRPGVYAVTIAGELLGTSQRLAATTTSVDLTCPQNTGIIGGGAGPEGPDVAGSPSGTTSGGCSAGGTSNGSPAPASFAAIGLGLLGMGLVSRRRQQR